MDGNRELTSVNGATFTIPDPDRLVHLQFRRFAGCPICNLHLRSFQLRHDEIRAAGVREVAVFHSPSDELRPYTKDLPFDVVGDPERRLYVEFGVESAPRSLSNPRAWGAIIRSVAWETTVVLRRKRPLPPAKPTGGRLGLPGDFLIAPDGTVLASKLGRHANDQWSVDELLALVKAVPVGPFEQGVQ
ncbi:MAG: peroxiredoxin-like family protein [Kibdelosporangium sp.]